VAFDFPSSPTTGQQFSPLPGVTYQWNGYAWDLVTQATILASGGVQQVYAENAALTSTTAFLASVDTLPQQTDGIQILTATITPKAIGNTLQIDVVVPGSNSVTAHWWAGVFRDSSAALGIGMTGAGVGGLTSTATISIQVPAASISPTTFKVRVGCLTSGNTTTINGQAATRFYGGASRATLTVTEFSPVVSPAPSFTGGNVLLATRVANNSAQLDFAGLLDSTYDVYAVDFYNVKPAVNNDFLCARISEGGVFQTAANYSNQTMHANASSVGAYSSNGNTAIFLTYPSLLPNNVNIPVTGRVRIFQPSVAGISKNFMSESVQWSASSATLLVMQSAGFWSADTNAIDGLRFLCPGGNMVTGIFKLYGVR
jgi:hypothetical protein